MKFLVDFVPVLLFFVTYFIGGRLPEQCHELATTLLGGVVRGGTIPVDLAPILLASAVAIVAITVQVAEHLVRRRRIGPILWTSFFVFLVFGGATIYFHDDTFIKWKPTVLYWAFAVALAVTDLFFGMNVIRATAEPNGLSLPDAVWRWLNRSWGLFFVFAGALNLYVAFHFSRSAWVGFKTFGLTGLTLVFVIGQSLILARYMPDSEKPRAQPGDSEPGHPTLP